MTTWTQKGYVVVSDIPGLGVPFFHGFKTTEFEARDILHDIPDIENLTNHRIIPAELIFETAVSQEAT